MLGLHARNISHAYRGRAVLREVTLELHPSQRLAIMGPNGAGKSTLLRLLAGLEAPSRGKVLAAHGGGALADQVNLRRRIVLVLQRPYLLNTSVLGNVSYGLRVRGLPAAVAREQAHQVLESIGFPAKAHRPARTLSGGESQLLNVARALAIQPDVLLLDEVTAHLDPENEARIEQLVQRYVAAAGTAMVLVTQDLAQATRLAAEGVMLCDGQIVERGRLPELLRQPRDPRAARFLRGHTLQAES